MKKTSVISLLLLLALAVSLLTPAALAQPARAAEGDGTQPDNGMVVNKTAAVNSDGSYTITLEAYATGEKISTEVKKDIPTDIILVLDQSGSMGDDMNTYGFRAYTDRSNSDLYWYRHNNSNSNNSNLYYPLGDGSYATVSVSRTWGEGSYTYTQCPADWSNSFSDFFNYNNYYANSNNLYVKVGEEYQKVTFARDGDWRKGYTYTYSFPDGSTFVSQGADSSPGDFDGRGPLYVRSETQRDYTYTYSYTDKDGITQTIGSSIGQNTVPTEFTLYERYVVSSQSRLSALKTAVTTFANSVNEKAAGPDGVLGTADDVNHRVAVVGYASDGEKSSNPWRNTELFIGSNQYNYSDNASSYYASAFQDMNSTTGQNNVASSINSLTADGATFTQYGLEMANGILNAYPLNENEKRNRVIVLFTDGFPGKNSSNFDGDAASAAINQASTAKGQGVSVYSVGIFNGADATSAGGRYGNITEQANWFMQNVSSNNGTPQNPSYYLSAADAGTLNSIFQQISDQIESGGSSTTLDEQAVIRDIISPQFSLPESADAADIRLETYRYAGENTWEKNADAMGASATVSGGQVSVTGFNFSENWCGTETKNGETTYRGNKLVISFTVNVKEGFLGGNDVPTNTAAGVYASSDAEQPVVEFPVPRVNVPIPDVTVTAEDKNVYLLGSVTRDQLLENATAKVGDVTLDLDAENFGLEPWQYAYVEIGLIVYDDSTNNTTDIDDTPEQEFNQMAADGKYGILLTVTPREEASQDSGGAAVTAKDGRDAKLVNVFKPELTYVDSSVYYGADAPTDFTGNLTGTAWKHNGTVDMQVVMIGSAPELTKTYAPDAAMIADSKIQTKQDIPVKATVKIGETDVTGYTTFVHTSCNSACGWTDPATGGDPAFLLHVATCELTVKKIGGEAGETYVMDVYRGDTFYTQVTVRADSSETIYELPVGTYSIQENKSWAWRYAPSVTEPVTLEASNHAGTVTCTNTKDTDQWLNDYSAAAKNTFGETTTEKGGR